MSALEIGQDTEGLYPVPAEEADAIVLASDDGSPVSYVSTGVVVREIAADGKSYRRVDLATGGFKPKVVITDSRIAVACSKYDKGKGGGPVVRPAIAMAAFLPLRYAARKGRAAARMRGKMAVGHVRYAWVRAVLCSPWNFPHADEHVRLQLVAHDDRVLLLDIYFRHQTPDALTVAREIVQRAARYRLARQPDEENIADLEMLASGALPPAPADAKSLAKWSFPTYYRAGPTTARR